jgi:hypothetical protein
MRVHLLGVAILLGVSTAARAAPPTWPRAQEVWHEGFDAAALPDAWEDQGSGRIRLTAEAAARSSARGVAVDLSGEDQTYLQRYNLTPWPHREFPRDTYLRIAVNANGVTIPAGEAVSLIRMRDADWNVMAGVRLRQAGAAYEVVLELPDGSLDPVALPLEEGWHEVLLGCRPRDWIGLWVDDGAPQVVSGVSHPADVVQVVLLGKADGFWNGTTPTGTLYLDEATLLFAAWDALWVDAVAGDDTNEGDTDAAPLRTLGLAALLAAPGTTVHVAPGDYRESVVLPVDGAEGQPLRFVADGGRGTARILGSNPATDLAWTRLTDAGEIDLPAGVDPGTATIWKADLAPWGITAPPRFVGLRGPGSAFTRLPLAREPDWTVPTPWKHHELWWAAEGGSAVTTCDPAAEPDCDAEDRSDRWLLDYHDDATPLGVEPGSLASLGDVTGALVHVKDTLSGHYTFKRRVAETPEPGRVRLEMLPEGYTEGCWFDHDPANPALGWNSKYFLEGLSRFLDTPGEWWFDEATATLYVWTPDGQSPDAIGLEVSVRATGFDLSHRSHVELVDLDLALYDQDALLVSNSDTDADRSYGLTLTGLDVGWATRGLTLAQAPAAGSPAGSQIRGLILRDSRIHDIDSLAIFTWTGRPSTFVRPGITDLRIVHNEFARIGFRDNEQGGGVGLSFQRLDHLLFAHNHVHDIAHNGVTINEAQTTGRGYDLAPGEILTGDILIRDNLVERCVQNATDAGGIKLWGATADHSHCFRDVLVYRNLSRRNVGWAWVSEQRDNWTYHGRGGMGYYIDYAGGIHFFRNLAADNGLAGFMASGSWPDQGVVLANNTIVNSPLGYTLGTRGALGPDTTALLVTNTIFLHLQRWAFSIGEPRILQGNVSLDLDLFHQVGYEPWPNQAPGILAGHVDDTGFRSLPTLAEVQAFGLEPGGIEGDPQLAGFVPDPAEDAEQDLRLTAGSTLAIDTGGPLPASLLALLAKFGIDPSQKGAALDRGAIERDPAAPDDPFTLDVGPSSGVSDATPPWDVHYPDPDAGPGGGDDGDGTGCGCQAAAEGDGPALLLLGLIAGRIIRRRSRRREAGRQSESR